MKSPLGYQISEFDCGPVSVINSLKFLFQREEISAKAVIQIFHSGMDVEGEKGRLGEGGTSKEEMFRIWNILESILPIEVTYQKEEEASIFSLQNCLKNFGCVIVRTYLENIEHYVLVTSFDNICYYLWDPYFLTEEKSNKKVIIDFHHPFQYNRIVSKEIFESPNILDFSLGPIFHREIISISRL